MTSTDYRSILRERVAARRPMGCSLTALAKACRIQSSYLSRVFQGGCNLNSDQLYLAAQYLVFTEQETKYLQLLLEYERSSLAERKLKLWKKILDWQEVEQNADRSKLSQEAIVDAYFGHPVAQLVHIFLHVPSYNRNPKKIAEDLGLSSGELTEVLNLLKEAKIISEDAKGRIHLLKNDVHLPAESPLHRSFQLNSRLRTIHHLQLRQWPKDDLLYNLCFSADEACVLKLKQLFNKFLTEARNSIAPAPSEQVYQMQFDLVRLTRR